MSPTKHASSRILIVDDEPGIRNVLGRCLRRAGFECAVADSAAAVRTELSASRRTW